MLAKLTSLFWTKPKTMEASVVRLPPDLPNWPLVKELLQDLQGRLINENISDQETCWFVQTVYNTIQSERRWSGAKDSLINKLKSQIQSNAHKKLDHNCIWFGLLKYLRKVSRDERDKFLYTILPNIIEFAVGIEDCRPEGSLQISRQQQGGSVKLSRLFVCSIVACYFLCLFPETKREPSKMNMVNFTAFFKHLPHPSQIAKLRCVLHYFECVMEKGTCVQGNILFCRKVAPPDWMLTFDELRQCELKLCPLQIHTEGAIEDSGPDTLQVCFGNKSIGGGVLGRSVVQEEIMFSTCPELMAAMLFTENMETNEAILVSGFHRFSSYSGYGDNLEFAGHYSGSDQAHKLVTIDAASYRDTPMCKQFEDASILRDLNKALIGFSWAPGTDGGRLQPGDITTKDESPGAVDVAADIVTSAMTDALRQASSPVDPVTRQLFVHLHDLSIDQPPQQDLSCQRGTDFIEGRSSAGESAAAISHIEQKHPHSSLMYSGSLHTAGSQACTAHQPSSSSAVSLEVSIPVPSLLQPSSSCSAISVPSATTSTVCPQISVHSSDSLFAQQLDLVGLPERQRQELTSHSSADEPLMQSSSALDSFPGEASGNQTDLAADAEFGAPIRSPGRLHSLKAHSKKLAYDVLGNFPRVSKSATGEFVASGKQQYLLYSTRQHEKSQLPEGYSCSDETKDVQDIVIELPLTSSTDTAANAAFGSPTLSRVDSRKAERDEPLFSRNVRSLTDDKYEDIVNSVDVVLSLPALQAEFERMSSGLSSSSLAVNVDSQSASANSAEEESNRQPNTEVLYINVGSSVETWGRSRDKSDERASSLDSSVLLEPAFSSSPQSSVSSANVSPNTSFLVSEAPSRSSDVHAAADFIPASDTLGGQARRSSRRESRDFYGELKDFLSSSSSGSRSSGSAGPHSSTASSSGSRSGSLSSHGTNGSTIDFPEFWSNFRRRSSQLSDTTSRRSSSSKHSSDFSTDLEEIAEGIQRHDHGVIEEEENLLSLVTEFASSFVSVAVRNGVTMAAQMAASDSHYKEEHGDRLPLHADKQNSEVVELDQLKTETELLDGDVATKDLSSSTFSLQGEQSEVAAAAAVAHVSLSSSQHSKGYELIEAQLHVGQESPTRSSSKCFRSLGAHVSPCPASYAQESATKTSVHPLASRSTDSGFSSGKSSIALRSEHQTLESLSEDTSVSTCTNVSEPKMEGLHSEVASRHLASDKGRTSPRISASLFPGKLEPDQSSDATVDKPNIPLSPTNKTLYAVLESKTVFLEAENEPKHPSTEQLQSDTKRACIPLHPAQEKDASGLAVCVEPNVHVSKMKSKQPKRSSTGAADAPRHEQKHFRRQKAKDETSVDLDPWYQDKTGMVGKTSLATEAGASVCSSAPHETPHPSSGAGTPLKTSGIPKLKDKRLSYSESSVQARSKHLTSQKLSSPAAVREKQKDVKRDRTTKEGSSIHSRVSTNKPMLKSHKSRYLFSDVAAPPAADTRRSKTTPESSTKKQSDKKETKKHDDKRRKQRAESTKHDPLKYTRSQKFIRFVNSLAEMSVSRGVLEGAEILVQRSAGPRNMSDELYNWFATKIVAEVFLHVLREIDGQQSSENAALSQPPENGALPEADGSALREDHSSSRLDVGRDEAVVPKPKSILPAKSDAQAPESKVPGQMRLYGSLKMVKFKDNQGQDDSSLSLAQAQVTASSKTNATPTFHRQSSSIPIPIRRRSSLDLPLSSSSSPPGASGGLTSSKLQLRSASPQQKPASMSSSGSLTSRDLSIDVYQTAAAIVSQVFQAVSDNLDAQPLSPVSSGRHGTLSSSDTAIHSTGSRMNSTYDSIASNIFSSSSPKASESPRRTRRSVSPSIGGIFSRKPMSRETLTNAFLKVDSRPSFKTYERRSSEPCQTSVLLSLQAFNSIKFSKQAVEDKQRKVSRTDDDIGRPRTWRRGSLDGFSFERRHSCGFKDPVLSRFAEELMKADTSVPELVIVGSNASSSSSGSRRSSIGAYKDLSQANIDSELLNTSFTSVCSLPVSHSSRSQGRRINMDRSRSRESRNWKSDSSDTEYWFPPPRIVGDEFQQEYYNRQQSQEELQDYASFFAGRVVQEAVCVLKCDPGYMSKDELDVELFAENLMDQIMRDAMIASVQVSRGRGQLVGDQGAEGDGSQNLSGPAEGRVVKGDRGDAKDKSYHAEGARPKSSLASLRARPKTKSVPQGRDARRRDSELDYQRAEDRADVSRQKNLPTSSRDASCASSASSISSSHSAHTGSSLPSSSGSEGIGPTGKDSPPRKHRAKRESESKHKTSRQSDSMMLNSAQKDRSRQRDSHGRRADAGYARRRSTRERGQHQQLSVGQRVAIDRFAASLSATILGDALMCCRDSRWMRFSSYQRPIATGNWGCGAFRGDAQLKLVIQWMAASLSRAPALLYYTFGDERLLEAEEVVQVISGQTVGQLAAALWDYCYWVRLNMDSSSSSSSLTLSARPQSHHEPLHQTRMLYSAWKDEQNSCLSQTLFDFLLEKFRKQEDR